MDTVFTSPVKMLPPALHPAMRGTIHIEPNYEELFSGVDPHRPFESLSEFFGFPLGFNQCERSQVVREELDHPEGGKVAVYFKLYGYSSFRQRLSRVIRRTRSGGEIRNLKFFRQLGIPACEVLLQGTYKSAWGIPHNCMLITREIEGTRQLDHFIDSLESEENLVLKTTIRRQIIESIATNLRKIHDHLFFHRDLKWRNILVRRVENSGKHAEVFWIDCPNGYFDHTRGLRKKHGIIKDLSTLDHSAKERCTQEERLYFLSVYSGWKTDSPELHQLASQVLQHNKLK